MGTENDLITEPVGDGVTDNQTVTTTTGQVSQGETHPEGTSDAESKQQLLEKQLQKQQDDLNKMKSSFQRAEAARQKEWDEQKKELEKSVRDLKLKAMSDDERSQFEANEIAEKNRNRDDEVREAQKRYEELEAKIQYTDYFVSQGIPKEKLATTGTLAELVNSGYSELSELISDLRKKANTATGDKDASLEKTPPPVDNKATVKTPAKKDWKTLIDKFGSEENVWKAIESGNLSPEVLPT